MVQYHDAMVQYHDAAAEALTPFWLLRHAGPAFVKIMKPPLFEKRLGVFFKH